MVDCGDRVRVVVAGIGGRGLWAAKKLSRDAGYELVGLCEQNLGKLAYVVANEALGDVDSYGSVSQCLDRADFDALVVTTPDCTHAEVAVPALEAGKHVFVEKPLDVTEEACCRLVAADARAGGKTFVGFNLRFAPVYGKIKDLIDEGAIGEVLTIQTDEFYDGGRTYFRRWNRLRRFGGGLWITKASHDFDLLYWLAGREPLSLCASAELTYYRSRDDAPLYCADCGMRASCPDSFWLIKQRQGIEGKLLSEVAAEYGDPRPDLCLYNSDKDTFDHGMANVVFEDGILGTYTCNVVAGFTERRIRVSGTRGTVDGVLGKDHVLLRLRDPARAIAVQVGAGAGGHGGADDALLGHFRQFVLGHGEPKVRPREAMVAVLMGLAATRSGDEGRSVDMAEFGTAT